MKKAMVVIFSFILLSSIAFALLSPPTVTATALQDALIQLTWDPTAAEWQVYASENEGFTQNIFTTGRQAGGSGYLFQGKPNTRYYFKVLLFEGTDYVEGGTTKVTLANKPINLRLSTDITPGRGIAPPVCGFDPIATVNKCSLGEVCVIRPGNIEGECYNENTVQDYFSSRIIINGETGYCGYRSEIDELNVCSPGNVCDYRHRTHGACVAYEKLGMCNAYKNPADAYLLYNGEAKLVAEKEPDTLKPGCMGTMYFKYESSAGSTLKWQLSDPTDSYYFVVYKSPLSTSFDSVRGDCDISSGELKECSFVVPASGVYYVSVNFDGTQSGTTQTPYTVSVLETQGA